jgi:hypothetical protein
MLSFHDFFTACSGLWKTERIYHYLTTGEIERSYTEFRVGAIALAEKQQIVDEFVKAGGATGGAVPDAHCPGFAIAFDTRSETGEEVSMALKALFIPDAEAQALGFQAPAVALPLTAALPEDGETIRGFYLRDEGYSESGAIAGRFTYQPTRQTLEMTTMYSRSVAVDQMRIITPTQRLRTIVTYRRPEDSTQPPTATTLVGFGLEHKF